MGINNNNLLLNPSETYHRNASKYNEMWFKTNQLNFLYYLCVIKINYYIDIVDSSKNEIRFLTLTPKIFELKKLILYIKSAVNIMIYEYIQLCFDEFLRLSLIKNNLNKYDLFFYFVLIKTHEIFFSSLKVVSFVCVINMYKHDELFISKIGFVLGVFFNDLENFKNYLMSV
jgi:hypothetical protein